MNTKISLIRIMFMFKWINYHAGQEKRKRREGKTDLNSWKEG